MTLQQRYSSMTTKKGENEKELPLKLFLQSFKPFKQFNDHFFIQSALEIIPLCAKTNSTNGCSNDTSMVFH